MPRVLISDALSEDAVNIFRTRGIDVTFEPALGKDKERLLSIIGEYDGLAIRSATKVTDDVIAAAKNLKVVGRAGIGVDNVDIPAATAAGIAVMNTPFGNSITTAEHAIAMMMSLVRQIPQANASTHEGKWEKSRFMGQEIFGKTLGLIGCGNIGAIVADRAQGLKMKVVAFDPYLTEERALALGVERVDLDTLFARADVITIHTPLTDQTRNVVNADAFSKMKDGVRIVNCARGGLVDEAALLEALESGKVAGAALDVFEVEPAKDNPLFGREDVICTPHLGASTSEAQENVAIQVAEQLADYLLTGAVTNALNMPSVSAEEAPRLKPYIALAEKLGSLAGQMSGAGVNGIEVSYAGSVSKLNVKPLTAAALAGALRPKMADVNLINAPSIASDRGIEVSETTTDKSPNYGATISVTMKCAEGDRTYVGALFGGEPRVVRFGKIRLEGSFVKNMLFVRNDDKPGFIGALGQVLSDAGINIATFHLGRMTEGDEAIALVATDGPVAKEVVEKINKLAHVKTAQALTF
ncbi:phosphoglycerate dehydrogenase [Parvularcula sp. LCG005]|uniref:phosphoglycerate dehydrogenase n=1 Tax=Parvularcula sp. LCG005 TaxID=3078805 RepID=UPI002943AEC4|nr:phosphoglycerate dehydrogenase [Parvularcula sp. LCG005]WOI52352.1 phosphoglycerate dehydrogenase [Parvularcula sp. LCG005]